MINTITKPNEEKEIFHILTGDVKTWFKNKFKTFALPQLYGVMPIHCRENVLLSSPTGSGKTLTAFLSIINELVDSSNKGILEDKTYAIYISPLKALGYDIEVNLLKPLEEIQKLSNKKINIRVGVRTGDTTPYERQKMNKNPPHILITTPESIAIMLVSPKFREKIKNVEWVIVDEIHSLAENKRGVHLSLMLEQLQYYNPGICRIGLSATVHPLSEIARYLAGTNRDCKIIDISYIKKLDMKVISPVDDLVNTEYGVIQNKLHEKIHEYIQSHKTTLIFTNTRAATEKLVHTLKEKYPKEYYEMQEKPPYNTASLIGAHHGSLSKKHRLDIENKLREGRLKCVVCSTSLELGIDIGSIDLVVLLGSPKSVARALQRAGRAGHQIHSITKARIIVQDRDDLIECSVLLKNALEHNIDSIHIPSNSYDVLVQHVLGFVINETINIKELYEITKESYCYKDLEFSKFYEIIKYLAGDYKNLENRYIFAKIYINSNQTISKRGKLTRMIYSSNIGTIPSQSGITMKIGEYPIGTIDEGFLEKLSRGDRFILGGEVYEYLYSRGMVAQVKSAAGKTPTIPRWFSETLPLSFDLAVSIQRFRTQFLSSIKSENNKTKIVEWIGNYLYANKETATAIYNYYEEQYLFTLKNKKNYFPTTENLIIENYVEENKDINKHYYIFHTLVGRRANEALSRVFAYILGKYHQKDIEIGINDNGFYLASTGNISTQKIIDLIEIDEFLEILKVSIENNEIVKRRFRQCAERSLMILRNYKGQTKNTGRKQVSSMILLKTARSISKDFIILQETYREIIQDLMDVENALKYFSKIKNRIIPINEIELSLPSPFSVNLILQGKSDIMSIGDKHRFLQNMHQLILAKISINKEIEVGKRKEMFSKIKDLEEKPKNEGEIYHDYWENEEKRLAEKIKDKDFILKKDFSKAFRRKDTPPKVIKDIFLSMDKKDSELRDETIKYFQEEFSKTVDKCWTDKAVEYINSKLKTK